MFFCFFFQAEDGIRDLTVTGVQTCALPIFIVENHGWLSSNGKWLASVVKQVNRPTCGTLPDFGNFHVSETEEYDRYQGVAELMPYAKGISAKSYEFDSGGNETRIDYRKMLKLVRDSKFRGYVGVEYE